MTDSDFVFALPLWQIDAARDIVLSLNSRFGFDPNNRPNNYTRTERKPSWLARRKQFAKDWKRMQKLGLKNEFLDRGHCYECGGELEITTDTAYLVGTPNPDYIPPAPLIGTSVTIPYAKRETK